ncbi:MAG: sigma-70 family RNA polymerase sigma factor [Parvularculaceae bacterium]
MRMAGRQIRDAAKPERSAQDADPGPARAGAGEPDLPVGEDFEALFKEHNEILVRFLAAQLGSQEEAQDAAQEAYVRVLGLGKTSVISHFRAYLFKTAKNIAIDRIRQRRRRPAAQIDDVDNAAAVACPAPASEDILIGRDKLRLLRDAIAELPPKCRYAFLQMRLRGVSCREIAADLGVTENMVRRYIVRAVSHCKSKVEE